MQTVKMKEIKVKRIMQFKVDSCIYNIDRCSATKFVNFETNKSCTISDFLI